MTGRRPLDNAIVLSADKLEFIRQSSPTTPGANLLSANAADELNAQSASSERLKPPWNHRPDISRPKRPSTKRPDIPDQPESLVGELLAPLTTRLTPRTADALRRATLEQRLKRQRPATQQEIVEQAISWWLTGRGYL